MAENDQASESERPVLLLTCEHGGNHVPMWLRDRFAGARAVLESHRGWDPGALDAARHLQTALRARLIYETTSRLVIEANRSPDSPQLYSEFTAPLHEEQRRQLFTEYYQPFREKTMGGLQWMLAEEANRVIHISVHSFTPVWQGQERAVDLGLLFDPDRPAEVAFCAAWKALLEARLAQMRVRDNEPYKGTDDGHTRLLRTVFPDDVYAGVELEMNQRLFFQGGPVWAELKEALATTLRELIPPRPVETAPRPA